MTDSPTTAKTTPPMLRARSDEETVTLMLCIDAIGLVRTWKFLTENPTQALTPRQAADLHDEREQWLERANRWSKNKPEYQVPDATLPLNPESHE